MWSELQKLVFLVLIVQFVVNLLDESLPLRLGQNVLVTGHELLLLLCKGLVVEHSLLLQDSDLALQVVELPHELLVVQGLRDLPARKRFLHGRRVTTSRCRGGWHDIHKTLGLDVDQLFLGLVSPGADSFPRLVKVLARFDRWAQLLENTTFVHLLRIMHVVEVLELTLG